MIAIDRRHVMQLGAAMAAVATGPAAAAEAVVDTGSVKDGKVSFPAWTADTERPSGGPPNPTPMSDRVGIAVVGLGRLSLEQILPAFAMSKRARLAGLVSGTPEKAGLVAAQYGISAEAIYGYDDWDAIARNPAIEAVYIVLPNALHKPATLRAAAAGKHVLCEKPMATSAADCQAMIDACDRARRTLMIAYRCQYEPHNRAVQALVRSGSFGAAGLMSAVNVQNMAAPSQWRFNKALAGGGALPDIGLYCLNGARSLVGEEPLEVMGRSFSPAGDDRFREIEATIAFMLRFPSGFIANCSASYGLHEHRGFSLHLPGAAIDLQNAFAYEGQRLFVAHRSSAAEAIEERRLGARNQFALELDHMADCVRSGRRPRTPGQEGLQDQWLMEAIYRSAATGQPVSLPTIAGLDTTRGPALSDDQG